MKGPLNIYTHIQSLLNTFLSSIVLKDKKNNVNSLIFTRVSFIAPILIQLRHLKSWAKGA